MMDDNTDSTWNTKTELLITHHKYIVLVFFFNDDFVVDIIWKEDERQLSHSNFSCKIRLTTKAILCRIGSKNIFVYSDGLSYHSEKRVIMMDRNRIRIRTCKKHVIRLVLYAIDKEITIRKGWVLFNESDCLIRYRTKKRTVTKEDRDSWAIVFVKNMIPFWRVLVPYFMTSPDKDKSSKVDRTNIQYEYIYIYIYGNVINWEHLRENAKCKNDEYHVTDI